MDFPESRPTLKMCKSVEYSGGNADVFVVRQRERRLNKNTQVQTARSCSRSPFQWLRPHRITESQNSRGWKGPLWVI